MPNHACHAKANPRQCQSEPIHSSDKANPLLVDVLSVELLLLVVVIIDVLVEVEKLLLVDALVVDVLPVNVPVVDVLLEVLVEVEDVLLRIMKDNAYVVLWLLLWVLV